MGAEGGKVVAKKSRVMGQFLETCKEKSFFAN